MDFSDNSIGNGAVAAFIEKHGHAPTLTDCYCNDENEVPHPEGRCPNNTEWRWLLAHVNESMKGELFGLQGVNDPDTLKDVVGEIEYAVDDEEMIEGVKHDAVMSADYAAQEKEAIEKMTSADWVNHAVLNLILKALSHERQHAKSDPELDKAFDAVVQFIEAQRHSLTSPYRDYYVPPKLGPEVTF
jgi:hypothetical protein